MFLMLMLLLALILTLQGAHGQSYSFVTDGHCTVPIANRAACDVAAQSLALADTSAIYISYTLHTPPGCIFAEPSANFPNGNLVLNTASSYSGCSTSKACICVAVPSCTNTNGTAPNAEPCTCVQRGGQQPHTGCNTFTGLYCFASHAMCSKTPFFFSKLTSASCNTPTIYDDESHLKRGSIADVATCSTAAHVLGDRKATGGVWNNIQGNRIATADYRPFNTIPPGCVYNSNTVLLLNTDPTSTKTCSGGNPNPNPFCLCIYAPVCKYTDGKTMNDATCICGRIGCTSNSGLYCDASLHICSAHKSCTHTNGAILNKESSCQCGTQVCFDDDFASRNDEPTGTGLYCDASRNVNFDNDKKKYGCSKTLKKCSETTGNKPNELPCDCGTIQCTVAGSYCRKVDSSSNFNNLCSTSAIIQCRQTDGTKPNASPCLCESNNDACTKGLYCNINIKSGTKECEDALLKAELDPDGIGWGTEGQDVGEEEGEDEDDDVGMWTTIIIVVSIVVPLIISTVVVPLIIKCRYKARENSVANNRKRKERERETPVIAMTTMQNVPPPPPLMQPTTMPTSQVNPAFDKI